MTATLQDIRGWIAEAQRQGARWLIVGLDRFDYCNYPIYVMPDADFYAVFDRIGTNGSGGLADTWDEVYDLSLDVPAQLLERRARHLPPRPVTEPA